MKSRSPRVVFRPSAPLRGAPPGRNHSHTPIATSSSAMTPKNSAVCQVQAIHPKPVSTWSCMLVVSDAAKGEALGDVVAHEVDHYRAGHDRERAGGRQQAELVARGTRCSRHHGRN